jgi:hypothetical protein
MNPRISYQKNPALWGNMSRHEAASVLAAFQSGYIEHSHPDVGRAERALNRQASILRVRSEANPRHLLTVRMVSSDRAQRTGKRSKFALW